MPKHSIRCQGFDYRSPGPYFVTLVIRHREEILAHRSGAPLVLTAAGRIVEEEWLLLPARRAGVVLDAHAIMPDHFHGILLLPDSTQGDRALGLGRPSRSLGALIAQFKAGTTRRINDQLGRGGGRLWQENYFERVIRDEQSLLRIREYILANPFR